MDLITRYYKVFLQRLDEVYDKLDESITFDAIRPPTKDVPYWSPDKEPTEEPCYNCDGTGVDDYRDEKCVVCTGTGKIQTKKTVGPELNVSNTNGIYIITKLLEVDYGKDPYSGIIKPEDVSKYLSKLIKIKNTRRSGEGTIEPTDTGVPSLQRDLERDGESKNVIYLTRTQARITDIGRGDDQIVRYIDSLIDIFMYAKKNNMGVGWS